MRIGELVDHSGHSPSIIESRCSVDEAIDRLQRRPGSALVVSEQGAPVGIFTGSDVLRAYLRDRTVGFKNISLKDVMTPNPIMAGPDEDVPSTVNMMLKTGINHLPVSYENAIIGILSIQQLMQHQVTALDRELNDLKDYIADLHDAGLD